MIIKNSKHSCEDFYLVNNNIYSGVGNTPLSMVIRFTLVYVNSDI